MTNDNVNNAQNGSIYRMVIVMLHHFLYDLKKSFGLLLLCILIVIAALFAFNFKQSRVYRSSFTVAYDELIRKVYGDRLDKLNAMIGNGKYTMVSDLLNIDKKLATSIKGVEGKNILGEPLTEDLNTDNIPFVVYLYTADTVGIKTIQDGVVSYLETGNTYMQTLKDYRKKQYADEIVFLDHQLGLLDTAKQSLLDQRVAQEGKSESLENIYKLSYDLYKRKQELLRKQAIPSTLHVIDEAVIPFSKGHSYIIISVLAIVLGMVLYIPIRYLLIPAIKYRP